MKKLFTFLPVMFAGASLLAQGTVNFGNVGTGTSISNVLSGAAVPAGTTFKAALYYLPDQGTAPTAADFDQRGTILNPSTTTFALAGQFIGGTRTTPTNSPPLGAAWFQVRAWESAYGSTYNEAVSATAQGGRLALVGTSSAVRVVQLGDGVLVGPGSLVVNGLKGFYVAPVPEPSVIGLGVLGIGALLLLRRKK